MYLEIGWNACSCYWNYLPQVFGKRTSLFTYSFLLISYLTSAQVESKAYETRLSGLLSHSVPEVSVFQISQSNDRIVFLDAREIKEYEVSHLKGARWVGYNDFNISEMEGLPEKTKIVVYCSVGYRSEKIAEKLIAVGFTDVNNLYGGIFEWKNQNNPVYKDQVETDEVHAYSKMWGRWLKKGRKVYD